MRGYDWGMAELTRERFVEQVFAIVPAKFPLVKLSRNGDPFSLSVNGHPYSLESLYRLATLNPQDMKRNVERWVVEILRAEESASEREGSFEQVKERILPMILPDWAEKSHKQTVTQPLLEGLDIAYAIDSDRTIAYLSQAQFSGWEISLDDLHATAIENLVSRSESMAAQAAQDEDGTINLIIFQTYDGYDASRILLPTLHDRLSEHLGSPFAAGIPNRDILLCFRDEPETVARIRTQIAEDYARMPHQLTDKLLLVTPDGIARKD
jgi:hypothetical protein